MFEIPSSTPLIKDALGPRRLSQIWKIGCVSYFVCPWRAPFEISSCHPSVHKSFVNFVGVQCFLLYSKIFAIVCKLTKISIYRERRSSFHGLLLDVFWNDGVLISGWQATGWFCPVTLEALLHIFWTFAWDTMYRSEQSTLSGEKQDSHFYTHTAPWDSSRDILVSSHCDALTEYRESYKVLLIITTFLFIIKNCWIFAMQLHNVFISNGNIFHVIINWICWEGKLRSFNLYDIFSICCLLTLSCKSFLLNWSTAPHQR